LPSLSRCQILRLKLHQIRFPFGLSLRPSAALIAPQSPDPLAVFKGPASKGEGKVRGDKAGEGERRGGNGGEGEDREV